MTGHPCLCGFPDPPQVGDRIQRGQVLGFVVEPGMRYARVVGYLRSRNVQGSRILIREFRPGDGRWPSGRYARVGWGSTPWLHDHPQTELDPDQEPIHWESGIFR